MYFLVTTEKPKRNETPVTMSKPRMQNLISNAIKRNQSSWGKCSIYDCRGKLINIWRDWSILWCWEVRNSKNKENKIKQPTNIIGYVEGTQEPTERPASD